MRLKTEIRNMLEGSPMLSALFGGIIIGIGLGFVTGFYRGRYELTLVNKIRTLAEERREVAPEPTKPTVTGGAYEPPQDFGEVSNKKRSAGIVEAKTPELLKWESENKLLKENGA
jgi:hypothetical protein